MDHKNGGGNGGSLLGGARGLVTPDGAPVAPRKRFVLECDCGSQELMAVGPYREQDSDGTVGDAGLRWVFTCSRCGNSLRLYFTSPAWRERREAVRMIARCIEAGARPCTCGAEHTEGCTARAGGP